MTSKTQPAVDLVSTTILGHHVSELQRAAVLVIGGIKGGIGKSTSSILLAYCYSLLGVKVLVLDADPDSGTTRSWARRAKERGQPMPFDVKTHPSHDLEERIVDEGWQHQYHLIIIDTGGHGGRILKAAYGIADFLLLTASPSPADLDTLTGTAQATVGQLGDRGISEYLLITAAKVDRMVTNARRDLRAAGINVLTNIIRHSVQYQDLYGWAPDTTMGYEAVRYEIEELCKAA